MIVEVDGVRMEVPDDATPDEIDSLSKMNAPAPKERTWGEAIKQEVPKFFGAGPVKGPQTMLPVAKGMLKAGALLVPGAGVASLLGSGAMMGAGLSDSDSVGGMAVDAGIGAATGLIGGKLIQGGGNQVVKNLTMPERIFSPTRALASRTVAPGAPIIKVAPTGGPAALAASPAVAPVASGVTRVLSTEDAVGRIPKLITGEVTPTANAQSLMARGVRLPRSMQDPFSHANQLDQAMQSVNPRLIQQRLIPAGDVRIAALNEALPPGMKPIKIGTPFEDAVAQTAQGFGRAYNEASGLPIYPAIHGPGGGPLQGTTKTPGMVEQAVASVKRLSDSQRNSITADVLDQLSRLPPRKGAVGQIDSGDLLTVRSVIRSRVRDFRADHSAESNAAAEAYEAAEDAITAALKSQLPTRINRLIEKADQKYVGFKVVDEAIRSARGSPDGFTAGQLQRAATKGESGVNIGSNDVSSLYELARAANDVFRVTSPPTGGRVATLQAAGRFLPFGSSITNKVLGAAAESGNAASMAATPLMKAMSVRPSYPALPPWQQEIPATAITPELQALMEALRGRIGRPRFSPAYGDQETPR